MYVCVVNHLVREVALWMHCPELPGTLPRVHELVNFLQMYVCSIIMHAADIWRYILKECHVPLQTLGWWPSAVRFL
jgi:hypothetical protein